VWEVLEMFTMKRRLLAAVFLATLAVAQVLPASAQQVSLNSQYCQGYGDSWVVYPTYIAGHTIRTAGTCYSEAYLYRRLGSTWDYVDYDYGWVANAYVSWSGASTMARTLHVLRDTGTHDGVSIYSYGW